VIHQVRIVCSAVGVQPFVTTPPNDRRDIAPVLVPPDPPPNPIVDLPRTPRVAQTTGEFLADAGLQLAINTNFFFEFEEKTPWIFYPHSGNEVYALGEAIASSPAQLDRPALRYGLLRQDWPALCFATDDRARIEPSGTCPDGTRYGIGGRDVLVNNGSALTRFPNQRGDKPYARTAVGVDADGYTLWLVIVDGKQPHYSEGMLLTELAIVFEDLEVDAAIALDGGGSSTLVIDNGLGPTLLNAPIQAKWPMTQRPIANHLGFYALPIMP
ncbi:MAG: phosphodiester glycosidase family protein, partial [Leptolyngbyaceae cyanobacterium]